MRRDVQEIFRSTPHEKQVMMFSATLSKEIRPVCKKFMQDVGNIQTSFWGLHQDKQFEQKAVSVAELRNFSNGGRKGKKEDGKEKSKTKKEEMGVVSRAAG